MRPPTPGLHHVSAIASDPRANVDFYTDVLGLRFVKRTVNFDDKFAYHLYYGDDRATPGTLLTFFPYPRDDDGRVGRPQPKSVAFSVPAGSAGYWYERLLERGIDADEPVERFGEPTVAFRDPDGLAVELVERDALRGPATDVVPSDRAIRNLHSVTLLSTSIYHTAATLEVLGFELLDQEGDRVRYRAPGEYGTDVDLLDVETEYGREGSGTIHHVAFGAGDTSLPEWRDRLLEAGLEPTFVKDRYYFESIYFREPGGILFEIATAEPGFTVDENPEDLGSTLSLPQWFEEDREMIVSQLPDLEVPDS
ncbi:VOC family protein [Natronomonas salina]|uniref:VOC family protein n=1 Tax=Natronomonas salina TaxID=1710540 RepID=UPI0015B5474D|nr:VOC family protein [Natronomonas salina]QLD87714.1 VOC family protein [Natronomonas salina]